MSDALLELRVKRLETFIKAFGLPTEDWLSPEKAGKVLCVSRTILMNEITQAEKAYATHQEYDVKHGVHYRRLGNNWQVNPINMSAILNKRQDSRPVVI